MSKVSVYEYNLKSSSMINLSDQLLRNQSPLVINPTDLSERRSQRELKIINFVGNFLQFIL